MVHPLCPGVYVHVHLLKDDTLYISLYNIILLYRDTGRLMQVLACGYFSAVTGLCKRFLVLWTNECTLVRNTMYLYNVLYNQLAQLYKQIMIILYFTSVSSRAVHLHRDVCMFSYFVHRK